MLVADLAYVKLIRLRGFDWLIAPRLYAEPTAVNLLLFMLQKLKFCSNLKKSAKLNKA